MHNDLSSSVRAEVFQLESRRLVVVLDHVIVVFRFINVGQFDTIAFELDLLRSFSCACSFRLRCGSHSVPGQRDRINKPDRSHYGLQATV
jgi:hypothetical protein